MKFLFQREENIEGIRKHIGYLLLLFFPSNYNFLGLLAHYQTTNFRLVQIEIVCIR